MNSLLIGALRQVKSFNAIYFVKAIAPVRNIVNVQSKKYFASKVLDVNTNVIKDVIIYKHTNAKFMKILLAFGVAQYTFWAYMAYLAYTSLKDVPIDKSKITDKTPWYMKINLGDPKYKNGLSLLCGTIALTTLFSVWGFTVRTVRYIVLHKGGAYVSFVAYSPVGPNRILKVPLHHVSCQQARNMSKGFIPIKVKKLRMNFLVDTKGDFCNPVLFDNTVGLNRRI